MAGDKIASKADLAALAAGERAGRLPKNTAPQRTGTSGSLDPTDFDQRDNDWEDQK